MFSKNVLIFFLFYCIKGLGVARAKAHQPSLKIQIIIQLFVIWKMEFPECWLQIIVKVHPHSLFRAQWELSYDDYHYSE